MLPEKNNRKEKMARLVSYKNNEDHRYSTFKNDSITSSNENLTNSSNFNLITKIKKREENKKSKWFCIMCHCVCCIKLCQKLCPCCCIRNVKCHCCCSQCNDDEDDIDGEFAKIKYEMSLKDGKYIPSNTADRSPRGFNKSNKNKKWNWDDSLRSNSDKFLETLEYDGVDGDKSLKRGSRLPKIRITAFKEGVSFLFILFFSIYSYVNYLLHIPVFVVVLLYFIHINWL